MPTPAAAPASSSSMRCSRRRSAQIIGLRPSTAREKDYVHMFQRAISRLCVLIDMFGGEYIAGHVCMIWPHVG